MIHVLADQNLYLARELLPSGVSLSLFNPNKGLPSLDGVDALIVRTVTALNRTTLKHPPARLKFIGTASSGTDHIETNYFEDKGIKVVNTKGCNAQAVAEYVLTALFFWREHFKTEIPKVGIMGAGFTGSAVAAMLSRFGIDIALYDPPRAETDHSFISATEGELLNCPILTFHVPLSEGTHPTRHWLSGARLEGRSFELIINAARGGVVDEKALLRAKETGGVRNFILDVWENEPDFNSMVAEQAFIATPHIAGYSEQAKIAATHMIYTEISHTFNLAESAPPTIAPTLIVELEKQAYTFGEILKRVNPIFFYDRQLRKLTHQQDKGLQFSVLRTGHPYRYEYSALRLPAELLQRFDELEKLGASAIP